MNRTTIPETCRAAALATMCAAAQATLAAEAPRPPEPGAWPDLQADFADAARLVAQLGEETLGWVDQGLRAERVVKGAPYCADAEHETLQPLADGNRIVQRQNTRLCRDGEGRTRQEVTARDGRSTVYLRDPVAKENWILDPQRKTVRRGSRIAFGPAGGFEHEMHIDTSAWRDYGERMRDWARQMAERARDAVRGGSRAGAAPAAPVAPPVPALPSAAAPWPPAPPAPVVVARSDGLGPDGDDRRREVELRILRIPGDDASAPMPSLDLARPPPAVGQHARMFAPRGPGVVTPLPAREIEGVRGNGERTTWTIEAGRLGNEKPIVITREVWTSPELMLTVQTRDFDPRTGEVNYRLRNLRRGEPDAALFKVPADYGPRPKAAPGAASGTMRG